MNRCYEMLNSSMDESLCTIKKKYHCLLMKWHPDKNNNSLESQTKTKEIIESYNKIIKHKQKSTSSIPNEFQEMGFSDTYPTIDQYVRRFLFLQKKLK